MNSYLIIGIVIFVGFVLGQEFRKRNLPKIIGYLLAGILLNPNICSFVPKDITGRTDVIENIAIAFISFAIGGTMVFSEIKKLGKGILYITLFEAEVTFLVITFGFLATLPFVAHIPQATTWVATFLPVSLLLGCFGSPTDPSVALAVTHQYSAKGDVTSTMLNVAGFDDILGIINFSVAIVIAKNLISHETLSVFSALVVPFFVIIGSIVLGTAMGFVFNNISERLESQSEGVLFVLLLSFLTLCWGLANFIHVEEILSIMTMGIIVTNFNSEKQRVFQMLERYSEELIMLLFFTLSGMHLDFKVMATATAVILLVFFIIYRILGKFIGTFIGANLARSSVKVKKYTASGLIPFGGIVIGLALIMQQDPAFGKIGSFMVSTVIGASVVNEFIGPFFVKKSLISAKEISE